MSSKFKGKPVDTEQEQWKWLRVYNYLKWPWRKMDDFSFLIQFIMSCQLCICHTYGMYCFHCIVDPGETLFDLTVYCTLYTIKIYLMSRVYNYLHLNHASQVKSLTL